jgi:hypothetical protein
MPTLTVSNGIFLAACIASAVGLRALTRKTRRKPPSDQGADTFGVHDALAGGQADLGSAGARTWL